MTQVICFSISPGPDILCWGPCSYVPMFLWFVLPPSLHRERLVVLCVNGSCLWNDGVLVWRLAWLGQRLELYRARGMKGRDGAGKRVEKTGLLKRRMRDSTSVETARQALFLLQLLGTCSDWCSSWVRMLCLIFWELCVVPGQQSAVLHVARN